MPGIGIADNSFGIVLSNKDAERFVRDRATAINGRQPVANQAKEAEELSMEGVVVIGLIAAVAVVAFFFVAAFFSVAFEDPTKTPHKAAR